MADNLTREKRSKIMRSIKGKDTHPEKRVRSMLHVMGYRFRLHKKGLPGRPDIVLPRYNLVIFVHGCFWHHHPRCQKGRMLASNKKYWREKIEGNIRRDKRNTLDLKKMGYHVVRLWECETLDRNKLAHRLRRIFPTFAAVHKTEIRKKIARSAN